MIARPLTEPQSQLFLDRIDNPHVNLIVKTIRITNMRLTELLHLRMADVDLERGLVHVHMKTQKLPWELREEFVKYRNTQRRGAYKEDPFFL